MGLHYVGIRVTDLDRSIRFYTRVMGLKVAVRGDHREYGRGIWVGLTDPRTHQKLELNWYPPESEFWVEYIPGEALDHVGFFLGRVPASSLRAEYDRLLRAGAKPTAITPDSTSGWQACVTDPDGNWIELFRWPTSAEARAERSTRRSAEKPRRTRRPTARRRRRR
jgi:catechol 2,3-dioxygenase-like lactoylglutathione lyase family enzyme